MSPADVLGIAGMFSEITRLIKNPLVLQKLKRLDMKLQNNHALRSDYVDEMWFQASKVTSDNLDGAYANYKQSVPKINTSKFVVKGVYEIDGNNALVLVLCHDSEVILGGRHANSLKKRNQILYFNLRLDKERNVIEMASHSSMDANFNNLLKEFAGVALH